MDIAADTLKMLHEEDPNVYLSASRAPFGTCAHHKIDDPACHNTRLTNLVNKRIDHWKKLTLKNCPPKVLALKNLPDTARPTHIKSLQSIKNIVSPKKKPGIQSTTKLTQKEIKK